MSSNYELLNGGLFIDKYVIAEKDGRYVDINNNLLIEIDSDGNLLSSSKIEFPKDGRYKDQVRSIMFKRGKANGRCTFTVTPSVSYKVIMKNNKLKKAGYKFCQLHDVQDNGLVDCLNSYFKYDSKIGKLEVLTKNEYLCNLPDE